MREEGLGEKKGPPWANYAPPKEQGVGHEGERHLTRSDVDTRDPESVPTVSLFPVSSHSPNWLGLVAGKLPRLRPYYLLSVGKLRFLQG